MKVLALGFSVTEQYPGYVGVIAEKYKDNSDLEIVRVGLGGLQHYHSRYLFPSIIYEHMPDVVIIDHATPAFRNWAREHNDYKNSLKSLLRECYEHSIKVALIDFPRTDVDYNNDWVTTYHLEVSKMLSIPYKQLPMKEGILNDEVHPTKRGNLYYAEEAIALIQQAKCITETSLFEDVPRYDSILASELCVKGGREVLFSRGGYTENLLEIIEEESLDFNFNENTILSGYSTIKGPKSGFVEVDFDGDVKRHLHYDQFCYYNRIHAVILPRTITIPSMSIKQEPEIPDIKLLKGDRNTQARIGAIGRFFIEDQTVQNSLLLKHLKSSDLNVSNSEVIDNVHCTFDIVNFQKPIMIIFSNEATIVSKDNIYSSGLYKDELKRLDINVIIFSGFEVFSSYRSRFFSIFISSLGVLLKVFPERVGYGSSLGGYGVSVFSETLNLDRVLLLNPISTLRHSLVPWEARFLRQQKLDWNSGLHDGAEANCQGYIVYDPLFNIDKQHAQRYSNLTPLKLYGVGHCMPLHLARLEMLSKLIMDFLNESIDESWFYQQAKNRRIYKGYYDWLLSKQNKRLNPIRAKVIKRYQRLANLFE
jgi:hypothetical protein